METTSDLLREMVEDRIEYRRELKPYRATILYDWPESAEHLEWALTAPVQEIANWARDIMRYDDEKY